MRILGSIVAMIGLLGFVLVMGSIGACDVGRPMLDVVPYLIAGLVMMIVSVLILHIMGV